MKKLNLSDTKKMYPKGYWDTFYELCQISRETYHCEKLVKFLVEKFKRFPECETKVEEYPNIYVRIKPTKGYEGYPSICFQGHMDMVCAKGKNSKHDFSKDPIEMIQDGNIIKANNTTLGADDGLAIATMFAILESKKPHGPLEFLITADEEDCMLGAIKSSNNIIKSPYLINLDFETVNQVIIGCQGALPYYIQFDFKREPITNAKYLKLNVENLRSGHSGQEIHRPHINALKFLFDIIYELRFTNHIDVRLVSIDGGAVKNALCNHCNCVIAIDNKYIQKSKHIIKQMVEYYINEFKNDENPQFSCDEVQLTTNPIEQKTSDKIVSAFVGVFNGMDRYDTKFLLSTGSTNIGCIKTTESNVQAEAIARGLYVNAIWRIYRRTEAVIANLAHGKIKYSTLSLPWAPSFGNNPLVNAYKKACKKHLGIDPVATVCGGGVEAGTLINKNINVKHAIACGPTIVAFHTPEEHCYIDVAQKHFDLIMELITTVNNWK